MIMIVSTFITGFSPADKLAPATDLTNGLLTCYKRVTDRDNLTSGVPRRSRHVTPRRWRCRPMFISVNGQLLPTTKKSVKGPWDPIKLPSHLYMTRFFWQHFWKYPTKYLSVLLHWRQFALTTFRNLGPVLNILRNYNCRFWSCLVNLKINEKKNQSLTPSCYILGYFSLGIKLF